MKHGCTKGISNLRDRIETRATYNTIAAHRTKFGSFPLNYHINALLSRNEQQCQPKQPIKREFPADSTTKFIKSYRT